MAMELQAVLTDTIASAPTGWVKAIGKGKWWDAGSSYIAHGIMARVYTH